MCCMNIYLTLMILTLWGKKNHHHSSQNYSNYWLTGIKKKAPIYFTILSQKAVNNYNWKCASNYLKWFEGVLCNSIFLQLPTILDRASHTHKLNVPTNIQNPVEGGDNLQTLSETQNPQYCDNFGNSWESTAEAKNIPVPVTRPCIKQEIWKRHCCSCVCKSCWL